MAADVGTVDSGLNSVVLANNNEEILLPINEPTFGTRRKSQIQTYLEQNKVSFLHYATLHSIIDSVCVLCVTIFTRAREYSILRSTLPTYFIRCSK